MTLGRTGVAIIGGGPAGLAVLLAANRSRRLTSLLKQGVTIVEQSGSIGEGSIGRWCIRSDSSGFTFADCLAGPSDSELAALRNHPLTTELLETREGAVPLRRAARFLNLVGRALNDLITASPKGHVLTKHRAISTQRTANGWLTLTRNVVTGEEQTIDSRSVVIATGASQPAARLRTETVASANVFERWGNKLVQSGDVLSFSGCASIAMRLAALGRPPRVAILGGSTSAAAVADLLLNHLPHVTFGRGGVAILHRRELRIFYPNVNAALADGYTEFGPDDICPVSGRVFRLAGFRLDSRELIMRARGIGGRPPEPRLLLHRLGKEDSATLKLLDNADLVIAAFGYRPHALPILDEFGKKVLLMAETSPQARLVDERCRVMNESGSPIPQLFGIGLGAGFVPYGRLGGEPSFKGQANGLWSWQSDVGGMIVESILRTELDEHTFDVSKSGGFERMSATQEAAG